MSSFSLPPLCLEPSFLFPFLFPFLVLALLRPCWPCVAPDLAWPRHSVQRRPSPACALLFCFGATSPTFSRMSMPSPAPSAPRWWRSWPGLTETEGKQAGLHWLGPPSIHLPSLVFLLPPSAQCTSTIELDHSLSTTDSALLPSEHVEGCESLTPVWPWETPEGTRGTEALTTLSQKRAARH